MWFSKLIALKPHATSRLAFRQASTRHYGLDLPWISALGSCDDCSILFLHQRRHFSIGRRHGWKGDSEKKPKTNFSEEFLEPAAHGELKEKHSSGIPKLSVRKTKGHKIQGDWGDGVMDDGPEDMELDGEFGFAKEGSLDDTLSKDISRAKAEKSLQTHPDDGRLPVLKALDFDNGKDPEYWREEDFDVLTEADRAYFRETFGTKDSLSGLNAEKLDQIRESGFTWKAPKLDATAAETNETEAQDQDPDKEDKVVGIHNAKRAAKEDGTGKSEKEAYPFFDESCDKIVIYEGDGKTDLPLKWSESRLYAYHPESKREPQPFYPQNRKNPHPLILEFFSRWLYVSGLPPAMSEAGMKFGKAPPLSALQEQEIQNTVSRLFGVSTDQVYPANEFSAFIGFETPESREQVASKGPSENTLSRPVTLSVYSPSDDEDTSASYFLKEADTKTLLKLENIPPHRFTRETLARDLFPKGSELGAAYPLSQEKVWFLSPATALLQFDSSEQVESALSSKQVAARMEEIGQYPIRLFKARRNILHDRMEDANNEIRKQGHRLIVDGDMPSKKFFTSHAGVIMLRNLDLDSVTQQSISDFFQPYSDIFRDVVGSVEFVTCYNGLPTDRAYVGFERLGEAEAVMEALKGRARIGDSTVILKLVKDRKIPGAPPRRLRPERTEDEIMKNLNDWEQYVDPEDLEYLEEHGVSRVVMDEALRGLRYHNRSFGALDWAMREEKLEPHKESGDDYREAVRMYVETLKECLATPENPGVVYEGMHFPGEPLDLSIFETDKQRIKKLLKRREA